MAPETDKKAILSNFRKQIAAGKPIVGGGAGTFPFPLSPILLLSTHSPTGIGLSAKFLEEGGADLIIIYNSGRFRMAGRGSLAGLMPFSNANDVVVDMAKEVLPIVKGTPVIAG